MPRCVHQVECQVHRTADDPRTSSLSFGFEGSGLVVRVSSSKLVKHSTTTPSRRLQGAILGLDICKLRSFFFFGTLNMHTGTIKEASAG